MTPAEELRLAADRLTAEPGKCKCARCKVDAELAEMLHCAARALAAKSEPHQRLVAERDIEFDWTFGYPLRIARRINGTEEPAKPTCPRCGSPRWVSVSLDEGWTRRAQCVPCGAYHPGVIGPG